tara:strand:+ start:780 stop:1535 length:756 start_codon:yes stop_codon:yes gene_type:complete
MDSLARKSHYKTKVKGQIRISGGRRLKSPKGLDTRPTTGLVREAVMNLLGNKLEGSNWLDLFSGSGSMSCEALQKGADRILAIEKDAIAARFCRSNLISITSHLERKTYTNVIKDDVLKILVKGFQYSNLVTKNNLSNPRFDFVYIDPPYESELYSSVLLNLLKGEWVKRNAIVICEYSSKSILSVEQKWQEIDRRNYGKSSLLLVTPPKSYFYDIDSMQQQTSQELLRGPTLKQFHKEEVQSFSRTNRRY